MKEILIWAAKALALWMALLAGAVLGSMTATLPGPAPAEGVPLGAGQALLLVSALVALIMAALAERMTGRFWQRAASLFVLLYVTETLLSVVESLFFGAFLHLPAGLLSGLAMVNAVKSAVAALVAAWLWRGDGQARAIGGLSWKLPAIILLYVILYFGAGQFIAWQSEAVRAYYGGNDPGSFITHLGNLIRTEPLLFLLQLARGLLWAAIAVPVIKMMKGEWWEGGLAVALLFTMTSALLLLPNPLMPSAVRMAHLLETATSNFLFGWLVAIIFLKERAPDGRETQAAVARP